MFFFLDTANLDEIKRGCDLGIVDGVTTNPSLMAKEGIKDIAVNDHYVKICEIVQGPVSAEVIATDYETMVAEGKALSSLHENIVVKIPFIEDGVKAIKTLYEEEIAVNCTLIFSPLQALIAAKAGATYVSPFIGRLDDIGHDGMELIESIKTIYESTGYETAILAASLRHSKHVLDAALFGADVATIPYSVMMGLFKHPLTDIGLQKFLEDHRKAQSK